MISADRILETTITEGFADYELDGAKAGYRGFTSVLNSGDQFYYCCSDNVDWEVGIGTLVSGSPFKVQPGTILSSSSSGAKVNWTAGVKEVFVTTPSIQANAIAVSADVYGSPFVAPSATEALAVGENAEAGAGRATAIGTNSVAGTWQSTAIGSGAEVYGYAATAVGASSNAAGDSTVAIGGASASAKNSTAIGQSTQSPGAYSSARGHRTAARSAGTDCWSTFQNVKVYQAVLLASTTNATPSSLFVTQDSDRLAVRPSEIVAFEATLLAHHTNSAGDGDVTARKYSFVCMRNGSSAIKFIGSQSSSIIAEDAGATGWGMTIAAGSTLGDLEFEVTGEAAKNITWAVTVRATSIGNS